MITLGIAKGRNDVKKIMDEIDEDGSGEIELAEFLQILKGKGTVYGDQSQSVNNSAITEFFKSKSHNLIPNRRHDRWKDRGGRARKKRLSKFFPDSRQDAAAETSGANRKEKLHQRFTCSVPEAQRANQAGEQSQHFSRVPVFQ
mgnify:CR=1 FL=1